ncbi:MAG: type II secretion system F family protein [Actinobacteria bacterium]|nr:type II secretion system F family protein [Actinomycetota bacterium]
MTAAVLGLSWACLVMVVARRSAWRGTPIRVVLPSTEPAQRRSSLAAMAVMTGRVALRVAGRTPTTESALRLGRTVLATGAALAVLIPAAPVVGALVWCYPAFAERRSRRRARAQLVRELPEVVDLFVLAVGAGLTVPLAVDIVARRAPGALGDALGRVVGEAALGWRLSDALEAVPGRVGEEVRPLVAALVASDRYGAPLLDGLERLGTDVRNDRRRRAEEAARRVPVKLLFPLVFCTLPAFALLTVAPLLAGSLRALRL